VVQELCGLCSVVPMIRSYGRLGHAVVIGAGPIGAATAVVLRKHGHDVDIYERYGDLRENQLNARRSINLVCSRRGLRLAESLGMRESLLTQSVAVHGRMMHDLDGTDHYQPYGHGHECNYALGRGYLNSFWVDAAEKAGARLHFSKMLESFDIDQGTATFASTAGPAKGVDSRLDVIIDKDEAAQKEQVSGIDLLVACDGAGSKCREMLMAKTPLGYEANFIPWGYKEISFPTGTGLEPNSLHIWPRGNHFLMGLANPDGSFTGTIYVDSEAKFPDGTMPELSGGPTFQNTTDSPEASRKFWKEQYPDVHDLLGESVVTEYVQNTAGLLGTVRLDKYHVTGKRTTAVLAGDSCHAIVPFFGQGVQCGFEDAFVFGEILSGPDGVSFDRAAAEYSRQRVRSCHALREMALDNMVEMGDRVGQKDFRLLKQLETRIETELSSKYRSRYALVCFSYNDYADVYEMGKLQHSLLEELAEGIDTAEELDMKKAEALIDSKLTPEFARRGMTLDVGNPPA